MSNEKKKSGCIGTVFKLFFILMLIGVVSAIFTQRHEDKVSPSTATTDSAEPPKTTATKPAPVGPAASPAPSTPPPFDIATVTATETPKKVSLKSGEEFPGANGSGRVTVPAGTLVDLVSRSGDMLRLSFMGGSKDIHYSKTTFAADVQSGRERAAQAARAAKERAEQAQKAQAAAEQAKQAAEQAKIESEAGKKPINSAWDGSVSEVKQYLKGHLKDPKSTEYIEWSPVKLIDLKGSNAWAVRVKYRSKNSFGGYVIDEAIAIIRHGEVIDYQSLSK